MRGYVVNYGSDTYMGKITAWRIDDRVHVNDDSLRIVGIIFGIFCGSICVITLIGCIIKEACGASKLKKRRKNTY